MSEIVLPVLFLAAAVLYSAVGHGGASAYLAVMALAGVAPAIMKPTALLMNVLVATITTVRFCRAGFFSWTLLWPFAISSIPFALLGGALSLPSPLYAAIVGAILLFSAYRLFVHQDGSAPTLRGLPLAPALLWGAALGFVSGLTGVGGGIFLSPLLLLAGWADFRQTAGVSSAFILVNSLAGLLGHIFRVGAVPRVVALWALAAALGGLIGSELGVRRLAAVTFRRLLAVVLVIAGL